ncbi:MAG: DUF3365 domain-containing protein [Deltaproteobacteria bacterium]|nr:DUF3365 domain-containing protein [Deltaproteobacteria bacterium]
MEKRVRNYFIAICALLALLTGFSLQQDVRQARKDRYLLAAATGRVLFHTIVATRSWNAHHGGVYVPVTETTRPNPYLAGPDRDIRTTAGKDLTKVNPAYMTRLVSDILAREGFMLHITSLKTLRPGNEPTEWERSALEKFDKGSLVEHTLIGPSGKRVFQYMEPLKTEASCLPCHELQGYRVGDVRGGISIAFPYSPYEGSAAAAVRKAVITHIVGFGIVLAVLLFFGRRIVELIRKLQEAQGEIRTLHGILPICSHCKKIRKEGAAPGDPEGWIPVDAYITDRSEAKFSHSICPECLKKHYGG